MENKVYYELGGTEFSEKAIKWFTALNRANGSSARYYETNSDQWGRPFGHRGYIVANNNDDIDKGLKILQSGRFERIPGDPTTLARWIAPSRGKTDFAFNMKRQNLADKAARKFNLSNRQWSKLANGEEVFVGEYILINQEDGILGYKNGAYKCSIKISGSSWHWSPELRVHRCDGGGQWESLSL